MPGYAWIILAVVFLASLAASLNQAKVPPVMPVLMERFNLSLTRAGMLMSIFAITGVILALPAGLIMQRLGIKVTALIAVGSLVVGSSLGALSNTPAVLLLSRFVEGIGMGLISVVAPAAITLWFAPQKRGTPMGIWATWVPLGISVMYILAPRIATAFGWQAIWWLSAAYSGLAFVLVLVFLRAPADLTAPRQASGATPGNGSAPFKKICSNRDIWLLAGAFTLLVLTTIGPANYYPTFLSTERGYNMNGASFTASLGTLVMLVFTPLAGILFDRFKIRKAGFTWPILAIACLVVLQFQLTGWLIPTVMILTGVIGGAAPTAIFAATPEIARKPELAGLGLSVITLGQNLGMFLGPILFGALVERMSWSAAGFAMLPLLIVGFFLARAVRVR
mgnify:CR=1 FL=1